MTQGQANAATLALNIGEIIRYTAQVVSADPWGADLVRYSIQDAVANGAAILPPERHPQPHQRIAREIRYAAFDAGNLALWKQARIVYDIDPDLWNALSGGSTGERIPAGLMRRLPHPDPFVAFPAPMRLPMSDGDYMEVVGFYVSGRAWHVKDGVTSPTDQVQVSTHAPNTNGNIGLLICAYTFRGDGTPIMAPAGGRDMVMNRVTLDVGSGEITLAEIIERIMPRFDHFRGLGAYQETLPLMLRACVGILTYLCARNAELRPVPALGRAAARAARQTGIKGRVTPPNVTQVGWQIGAQLRAWRAREQAHPGAGTGGKKRPHLRRFHPHLYRVGPGRREIELKWLDPIKVNMKDGDMPVTTVVPVT